MKSKILLLFLFASISVLHAQQDTIRSLMITEAFLGSANLGFFELTNMSDEPIQLGDIEFGCLNPNDGTPYEAGKNNFFMFPDFILQPGACYVMAQATDFEAEQFALGNESFNFKEKNTKDEFWEIADMLVHIKEPQGYPGDPTDSVTIWGDEIFRNLYHGRSCYYLEQHFSNGDSVVIDQINGVFDDTNGGNISWDNTGGYDVAGYHQATRTCFLLRKFSIKEGNLDFASARGIGKDDSEWITVPREGGVNRAVHWTVGNHGDYNLDENTLESSIATINFVGKTISVPWGTLRGDDIMISLMKKKPGIAWNYHLTPVPEDSLGYAAKTGDQLEIFVAGNDVDVAMFDIIVEDPQPSCNIVVPVQNVDNNGNWRESTVWGAGSIDWPRITRNESGIDTIWGRRGGIPYATRVDSLLERLDKSPEAQWDLVWVDGVKRADLKDGDKLKVTAKDGSIKEYHISVLGYRPSHDATLSSITWPDIPDFYRGLFGWIGDTIPSFGPTVYNYRVQVPLDSEGIPAMVAKTTSNNAKITVDRAANLSGTMVDRTIKYTVQAEDDTTFHSYEVELVKEKDPVNVQPYYAEPFLSEFVYWDAWANCFGEICNPGNQPLDLSNYMFAMQHNPDPAAVISMSYEFNWLQRYNKYVPGYKWVGEQANTVTPDRLEMDLNVNPIVMPGDVFCFGTIKSDNFTHRGGANYVWPIPDNLDVQFNNKVGKNGVYSNPWNEPIDVNNTCVRKNNKSNWYMFKILNDSIKKGLKPATDPADFKLIESFGMANGTKWVIGGKSSIAIENYIRKPEIYKPNPVTESSFGTNPEDAEWTWTNQKYWSALGYGFAANILYVVNDIGKHFMIAPTHYISTVSSVVYKVTEGYGKDGAIEGIRGMPPGLTVADFLGNLILANENQTLTVKSTADGSGLSADALLSMNDTLVVMSADSVNTTKYLLEVAEGGLSSNAVLTSAIYDIEVQSQPKSTGDENDGAATIAGFEYGTSLQTVVNNVTVPSGASMDIVNANGSYVPLKMLNLDTVYVNVTVNANTYFVVTAEDGTTRIVYHLMPESTDNDAFVLSDVYSVVQKEALIEFLPRGTNVESFTANLIPSAGATMVLVDKLGIERYDGYVADDDKLIVTSPNGEKTKVYFISMLAEEYIPETTYLAYILSNIYGIDQVENKIMGVSGSETLAGFYSKITPCTGATAVVVDANGNEKTIGDIEGGDQVKVTSADGKIEVMYSFGVFTSSYSSKLNNILLYPNPTDGKLNISGLNFGNHIKVYNSLGVTIVDVSVHSSIETVSLDNQPTGMYLIVISNQNNILGSYKALRK